MMVRDPDLWLAVYRELPTAELEEMAIALKYDLTVSLPDAQRAITRARIDAIETVLAERRADAMRWWPA